MRVMKGNKCSPDMGAATAILLCGHYRKSGIPSYICKDKPGRKVSLLRAQAPRTLVNAIFVGTVHADYESIIKGVA